MKYKNKLYIRVLYLDYLNHKKNSVVKTCMCKYSPALRAHERILYRSFYHGSNNQTTAPMSLPAYLFSPMNKLKSTDSRWNSIWRVCRYKVPQRRTNTQLSLTFNSEFDIKWDTQYSMALFVSPVAKLVSVSVWPIQIAALESLLVTVNELVENILTDALLM